MHEAWKKAQTGRGSLLPAAKKKRLYWCKKQVPAESQATQQLTISSVTDLIPKWLTISSVTDLIPKWDEDQ
ncbi:hypothetical protein QE152_g4877 [Popillia japonica]|uniref:Uncharacterized protein n=1 Tax=Popillia japonica TaxID=7064 RepID=A0AAW1MRW5_POPJA